ncbi:Serine/threonine-protein kinase PknB [Anatilimnocola aggregata]|uniref:Serine/threonine-protein kinase PknB n=1 Tax=Anatilimnocola aggregata TaxID=2528021 RepID=A0A517YBR5_9BACT|nr:protein kinase [Anatilimnocola aggregata]QDU27562.1 Serine/threonine-protein kinase PknB [Anatilimnocola aggregata]
MSIPIPDFWSLLQQSRLLAPEQCQQLAADFSHVKGASDQSNARTLAEWLVARNVLSRYQTMILLAGRPGPFHYGDYKVYDRIEKGRLAGAFRAVHGPTGHPVLLQFLTGAVIQDPSAWADAVQNTLAACAVQSPHVQRFFEPVDLGSFKFVVAEDLRGAALDERLAMGRFPAGEAARLARQAAIGLAQLHQSGRAHGDLRPANLFLDTSVPGHPGDVKVLFDPHTVPGAINFAQADAKLTLMSDYLAPELMHAGRAPDPLSDVYALGCTLYCLLAGSPPFTGGNVLQKMTRHATEGIRPLEPLGVPPPLAQLVTYMLAKNPQVRYQSAAIVAEQLAPFVDPQLLYSPPPQPLPTQGGFEHWVAQKQAQLAAAAQPTPQPELAIETRKPGFGLRIQEAGEAVVTAKSGTSASPLAGVALAGAAPSPVNRAITSQELIAKKEKDQTRTVITALVGVGAVAISLILVVYAMNQKPAPTEVTKVVTKDDNFTPIVIERIEGDFNPNVKAPVQTNPTNGMGNPGTNNPLIPGTQKINNPVTGPAGNPAGTSDSGPTQQVVADDGQLLWASPTSGKPVEFRLVPPEGQIFIVARPAEILAASEGTKVLDALGPQFSVGRTAWEQAAGVSLNDVEQIIITLHNNEGKFPRVSHSVQLKTAVPSSDLIAKWGNPAETQEGNNRYYLGQQSAFFVADSPTGAQSFLMGDPIDVKEVAMVGGAPPLMARDLERLRRSIDGARHVSVMFNPDFFDNDDGQTLFQGDRAKVRQPLDLFLGDDIEAGLLSMQFDSAFYLEFRMFAGLNRDPFGVAQDLRTRLKAVPNSIFDYVASINTPDYWRRLSMKFPGMIEKLHDNMRVGVEGDQAIVNAYLPGSAAHNLVLGGELLVASAPGAGQVASGGPAKPTGPKSIEEVLALKTSMQFDANPLEFCMRDLAIDAQEVAKGSPFAKGGPQELNIKIIGDDLKIDGITRNQTVRDFNQQGKSISDILTALVMKANPVTTVKTPDEADQKLLWVVGPDPDNPAKQMILITTRAAAATKKYTLPPAFRPKGQ